MKIELVRKAGNRVEIAISADGIAHTFYGPISTQATEQMLVTEAERFHKALGDAIKAARQAQNPGVRKIGTY